MLEPSKCEDPHVERLLEAFAFLAARVHLKIDDDFPEITEALLGIVYPHFIRPLPFDVHRGSSSWIRRRASSRPDCLSSATRCSIRGRWTAFRASSAPATTPRFGRSPSPARMDDARPLEAAAQGCRRDRSAAASSCASATWSLCQAGAGPAPVFSGWRERAGPHDLRAALLQPRCRSWCAMPPRVRGSRRSTLPAVSSAARWALRRTKGMLPYSAALVPGLPAAAGVLHLSREILLPGCERSGGRLARRVSNAARTGVSVLALSKATNAASGWKSASRPARSAWAAAR